MKCPCQCVANTNTLLRYCVAGCELHDAMVQHVQWGQFPIRQTRGQVKAAVAERSVAAVVEQRDEPQDHLHGHALVEQSQTSHIAGEIAQMVNFCLQRKISQAWQPCRQGQLLCHGGTHQRHQPSVEVSTLQWAPISGARNVQHNCL